MAITSFMDVAGGIASTDGTRISEGAGGVINVNNTDGSTETFMTTADGGLASVGADPTIITPTATGFTETQMSDPATVTNFTETPSGFAGSDGTSITDTGIGTTINTPDPLPTTEFSETPTSFGDIGSSQSNSFDLSSEIGMNTPMDNTGIESAGSFDMSGDLGLPSSIDLSSVDTSNMDISSLSAIDISQVTPDVSSITNMIDVNGDGIADIVSGIDLDGDGIIDTISNIDISSAADYVDEETVGDLLGGLFEFFTG